MLCDTTMGTRKLISVAQYLLLTFNWAVKNQITSCQYRPVWGTNSLGSKVKEKTFQNTVCFIIVAQGLWTYPGASMPGYYLADYCPILLSSSIFPLSLLYTSCVQFSCGCTCLSFTSLTSHQTWPNAKLAVQFGGWRPGIDVSIASRSYFLFWFVVLLPCFWPGW